MTSRSLTRSNRIDNPSDRSTRGRFSNVCIMVWYCWAQPWHRRSTNPWSHTHLMILIPDCFLIGCKIARCNAQEMTWGWSNQVRKSCLTFQIRNLGQFILFPLIIYNNNFCNDGAWCSGACWEEKAGRHQSIKKRALFTRTHTLPLDATLLLKPNQCC